MSDEPIEGQEPEADETEPTTSEVDPRIKKANEEAARYRRELRAAQAELEKLRKANQTEAERAIAEAEERGKKAAQVAAAARVVKAEIRAAAIARGVPKDAIDSFLEYADPSKFLDDKGEPDEKAIERAIERLAPVKATSGRPVADLRSAALPAGETAPSSASDWMRQRMSR